MTQKQRILHALETAGPEGLVASDFMVNPADGGAPILRVAARVHDLRTDGHVIRGTWDSKMSQERYVLAGLVMSQPLKSANAPSAPIKGRGTASLVGVLGGVAETSEGLFDTALFDKPHDHYLED